MIGYLRIQNDGVASEDLFLRIGASSSRGDASRIGQFGNGAVLGSIALLREGIEPVIFVGTKRLEYVVEEEIEGVDPRGNVARYNPLLVKISNKKPRDTGIALQYGALDWTPEMGVREHISNAIDYSTSGMGGVRVDLVEHATPRAGKTIVYIPCKEGDVIHRYYQQIQSRFLHFAYSSPADFPTVIDKGDADTPPNIYRKGVWVCQLEGEKPSLFDYNLGEGLHIDEARNLGNRQCQDSCLPHITSNKKVITAVFRKVVQTGDFWEASLSKWDLEYAVRYDEARKTRWCDVWQNLYGDNTVIATSDHSLLIPYARDRGFRVLVVHSGAWFDAMSIAGIPTVLTALDNVSDKGCEIFEPTPAAIAVRDRVWDWVSLAGLAHEKEKPIVKSFRPIMDKAERLMGFYDSTKRYIGIREGGELVECMAEEIMHHLSGDTDLTREFQTFAISAFCKLAVECGG